MSSRKSLYRYIFHGTRLNIVPQYRSTLSTIGLNDASNWLTFNTGKTLSSGKTTCLKITLPSNQGVFYFKRYVYKKIAGNFSYAEAKPLMSQLTTNVLRILAFLP